MRLLVHFHVYYHDQVPYYLHKLAAIGGCDWDLFVTWNAPSAQTEAEIRRFRPDAHFLQVENVGYDIWPFVSLLRQVDLSAYDLVMKLHTKSARGKHVRLNGVRIGGYRWRDLLVDALLDSPARFASLLNIFAQDSQAGLACNSVCVRKLSGNLPEDTQPLQAEMARLGLRPEADTFCAGTMFLARMAPFARLRDSDLRPESFDASSASSRIGSMAHIYERICTFVVTDAGYRIVPVVTDRRADFQMRVGRRLQPFFQQIFRLDREGPDRVKVLTLLGHRFILTRKAAQDKK